MRIEARPPDSELPVLLAEGLERNTKLYAVVSKDGPDYCHEIGCLLYLGYSWTTWAMSSLQR
jgi:hypothetical protein